jgi:hypothetical protein
VTGATLEKISRRQRLSASSYAWHHGIWDHRVTDLMPVDSEGAKARELWPEHEVVRKIESLSGHVEVEVVFDPRFDCGQAIPQLRRADPASSRSPTMSENSRSPLTSR